MENRSGKQEFHSKLLTILVKRFCNYTESNIHYYTSTCKNAPCPEKSLVIFVDTTFYKPSRTMRFFYPQKIFLVFLGPSKYLVLINFIVAPFSSNEFPSRKIMRFSQFLHHVKTMEILKIDQPLYCIIIFKPSSTTCKITVFSKGN